MADLRSPMSQSLQRVSKLAEKLEQIKEAINEQLFAASEASKAVDNPEEEYSPQQIEDAIRADGKVMAFQSCIELIDLYAGE